MEYNLEKIVSIIVFIFGVLVFGLILGTNSIIGIVVVFIWAILFGIFWKKQFM
ncbi:MAG: hypothetical protein LBM96_09625 [Methanobrevibacter sp.]|jgi:hypothetical protein|nr:hypothetical protein [Candidatus Methanoflexus mossambicus]